MAVVSLQFTEVKKVFVEIIYTSCAHQPAQAYFSNEILKIHIFPKRRKEYLIEENLNIFY